MLNAIGNALSGLLGASKKAGAVASNIANLNTTGSLEEDGKTPYSTLTTAQNAQDQGGVKTEIIPKNPGFVPAYSPDSPFANSEGLIGVPNTDLAEEAVNLSLAKVAYKANVNVLRTIGEMQDELLEAFDREV